MVERTATHPLERNSHLLRCLSARAPTQATQQSQAVATLRSLPAVVAVSRGALGKFALVVLARLAPAAQLAAGVHDYIGRVHHEQ